MKFLGIDYGTKRIGIAISDENTSISFPKEIIINSADALERIGRILTKESIGAIVIGESVDFSGKLNPLSAKIEDFISELRAEFGLPIHKQKEFLTSVEARRHSSFAQGFGRTQQDFGGQARRLKSGGKINPTQAHSRIKQAKSERADANAAALILQRYLDRLAKKKEKK